MKAAAEPVWRSVGSPGGERGSAPRAGVVPGKARRHAGPVCGSVFISARAPLARAACRCLCWVTSPVGFTQGSASTPRRSDCAVVFLSFCLTEPGHVGGLGPAVPTPGCGGGVCGAALR